MEDKKIDFEEVRSVLKEAVIRGLITDTRYDGQRVTYIGLFIHHGFTTREIAFMAGVNEPVVRKLILETYRKVKIFL